MCRNNNDQGVRNLTITDLGKRRKLAIGHMVYLPQDAAERRENNARESHISFAQDLIEQ
jgi:hypothetical protein